MVNTMKAAVLKAPGELAIQEVPIFKLKHDEVQIKVLSCGICGSDLRYFVGENPWALHTLGKHVDNPPNIILGHEFCGIVCDVGSNIYKSLLNRRVVVLPFKSCGNCYDCHNGNYNICKYTKHLGHAAGFGLQSFYAGGMAEYCPIWAANCYIIPENISDSEATFFDVAAVGIHALNKAGAKPGQSVLTIGCGPLGFSILSFAPYWGAVKLFATEPSEKAREIISSKGVVTFTGSEDELDFQILSNTNNIGVDAVFDTVGTLETQALGRKVLASYGVMVNLAVHHNEISFFMDELGREKSICSSCNFLPSEFRLAIDMVTSGKIDLKSYITHEMQLIKVREAFEIASDRIKSGALKIVLKP